MALFDTRADWDTYYRFPMENNGYPNTRQRIFLNYNDFSVGIPMRDIYAPVIANTLGIGNGSSVAIVGSGFNWTGEGLANLGASVIGTDLSSYIHAEKGNTEEAELREKIIAAGLDPDLDTIIGPDNNPINPLDLYMRGGRASPQIRVIGPDVIQEDGSSVPSRRDIANAVGGSLTHIITEEVLNSVDDATALTICDIASQLSSRFGGVVTHILSPLMPDNPQRAELNWKSFVDWRTFLNTNGFSSHQILSSVGASSYTEIF